MQGHSTKLKSGPHPHDISQSKTLRLEFINNAYESIWRTLIGRKKKEKKDSVLNLTHLPSSLKSKKAAAISRKDYSRREGKTVLYLWQKTEIKRAKIIILKVLYMFRLVIAFKGNNFTANNICHLTSQTRFPRSARTSYNGNKRRGKAEDK